MAALPCGCRPSDLLRRALALIDPPPTSSVGGGVDLQGRGADPSIEGDAASIDGSAAIDVDDGADGSGGDEVDKGPESPSLGPQKKKKAVLFSVECKPPKQPVAAGGALRAYDLLVHAASVSSSPPSHSLDGTASNGIDLSASWESLQVTTDVYRALLVASCLLLELLPREASIDGSASCDSARDNDPSTSGTCPLGCIENSPVVPPCCPAVEKRLLSTARRCILLLRVLERICSAKAIAEGHGAGGSFCPRGDDIRDYDRATADLHANYDWHDDGGLPPPCSATHNGSSKHSILRECLCLPIRANDPPSSRFERSAWTRPLLRGERIVSLRLEDYAYREERDECEGEAIIEETIVEEAPVEEEAPVDEDDAPLLSFSVAEMAKEEECLLDIMLPEEKATENSNKGLTRVQKRRRGRKRRRGKGPGQSESFATTGDNMTTVEKAFAKEGFLLLVIRSVDCSQSAESDGTLPPPADRVHAQLHPSGCLSIEDRSIRSRINAAGNESMHRQKPMAHRRRYRDFWIGPQTQCTPCLPEGTSAFHFRLEGVRLLGASTLGGVHDINGSGTSVDLLLSVDEGTGGSFIDGYEWVTALSGAASDAASLQTSIRSEWERDQRERESSLNLPIRSI